MGRLKTFPVWAHEATVISSTDAPKLFWNWSHFYQKDVKSN